MSTTATMNLGGKVGSKIGSALGSAFKFEKGVLMVATCLLILLLAAVGVFAYYSKYGQDFPPVQSECPDYWKVNEDKTCTNVKNLGSCNDGGSHTMDFNTPEWTGDDGLTKKCHWAQNCDIVWDGVTNNKKACDPNNA